MRLLLDLDNETVDLLASPLSYLRDTFALHRRSCSRKELCGSTVNHPKDYLLYAFEPLELRFPGMPIWSGIHESAANQKQDVTGANFLR